MQNTFLERLYEEPVVPLPVGALCRVLLLHTDPAILAVLAGVGGAFCASCVEVIWVLREKCFALRAGLLSGHEVDGGPES